MPSRRASAPTRQTGQVTAQRSARFYKLLMLLRTGPKTREHLSRRLGVDMRGFYRDLKSLRELGAKIDAREDGYELKQAFADCMSLLPFPDPQLNLSEAIQLAKGKSGAHRKLQAQIRRIAEPTPRKGR